MFDKSNKHLIVSAPYRISLGGGGTDLPFYAQKKGGFLITAAIDEYITVLVAKRQLDKKLFLQYSKTEMVEKLEDINHVILREILKYYKIKDSFQIATFSTMPTYTGLGASSTLIVAIIKAINELYGKNISKIRLAEEAYRVEREILGLSGGFQDQYIASFGGIQILNISKNLKIKISSLNISPNKLRKLQKSLILIYSGIERKSESIINEQKEKILDTVEAYDQIKKIGKISLEFLKNGEIENLGKAMDDHWKIKNKMTASMSNSKIDGMYEELKSFGSPGGKIIGAGGGGFFLMAVEKNIEIFKKRVKAANYNFVEFSFEKKGAHVIQN